MMLRKSLETSVIYAVAAPGLLNRFCFAQPVVFLRPAMVDASTN
jgi:hypothetical protein